MDPKLVQSAFRLQSLVDNKHQFARNFDPFTKQLIRQITQTHTGPLQTYSPTREALQAELAAFASLVFRRLSAPLKVAPPPPSPDSDAIRQILAVVQNSEEIVIGMWKTLNQVADRV